jgi:acyl carrier protein
VTREEIKQKITDILTQDFGVPEERVTDDATFRGSFALDSLDIVDFILLLQKDFGFKAPSESYQDVQNVATLVDFVAGKLASEAA